MRNNYKIKDTKCSDNGKMEREKERKREREYEEFRLFLAHQGTEKSNNEVIDLNDLEATKELLKVFVQNMRYAGDYKFRISPDHIGK